MTNQDGTHYRKVFDSPYLSSMDVVEPITLTIARVTQEADRTKKTKDTFNTAHFVEKFIRPGEKLKPMILNATNSKVLAKLAGTPFIEDWSEIRITVYVEHGIRFGRDTVDGLRVEEARAAVDREALLAAVTNCNSAEEVEAAWKSGGAMLRAAGDKAGYDSLKAAVLERLAAIRAVEPVAAEGGE